MSGKPEHICGWSTPSGIVMRPSDCGACVAEKEAAHEG